MDIFDDTGEGTESIQPAEAVVEQSAPAQVDSTEGAAPDTSTVEETPQGAEGQEAPAATTDEAPTEDEIATLEKEVETALADERTPKWFKNAVENVYKPKLQALTEQVGSYEPLTQFGSVEEIGTKLQLLEGLLLGGSNTIRTNPQTGMPERTTADFVKGFYEQDAKGAYQLLNDLVNLPSPEIPGYTVLQEILEKTGIDPTRLDDVRTFAANGYQLQKGQYPAPDADDLALIPRELQPTFASLSPEEREDYLLMSEGARDAALNNARLAQESERINAERTRTEAETQAQAEAQKQAEFKQVVDQKGYEHYVKSGETILNSFVDSLAKQANMTSMDSLMIATAVLTSMEPTVAGRQLQEAFKADGITVDPAIPQTITQLEENAKHIAYYEVTGDKQAYERSVAKQVELQERLTAKSNKIIAALALKKASAQSTQTQNASLAVNNRYAAAGVGSTITTNGKPNDNYDDEEYRALLRSSPGFGQR